MTGNVRVWFDDLPAKSIDNYVDLKKAFLENYLQQKKCIKDPIEIHKVKHRDRESMEDFVKRGEVVASNHKRKKSFPPWKQQEDKGKFKAPPPMTTPVKKRNHAKFCEFHEILFPPLDEEEGTEGTMIIEAEIRGHCIHRMIGDEEHSALAWMNIVVVRSPSSYNGINERPGVRKQQAVPSTAHGMLKLPERVARQRITQSFSPNSEISFPPLGEDEGTEGLMIIEAEIGGHYIHRMSKKVASSSSTAHEMLKLLVEGGVITLKSSRRIPLECAMVSRSKGNLSITKQTVEGIIKMTAIQGEVGKLVKAGIMKEPADMTGVPRHIVEHRLNVREGCSLVRQKKRGQTANRNQAIQGEVGKLVKAGIMQEVHYHDWLSNPMMVKKHDE
nr:hypothetical protein [Tanacetum cinerariifolium]